MTRPFAWLHLQTRLPEDWEMTLYSLDPAFGELRFYTRAGLRASLDWRPAKIPRSRRGTGWTWEWTRPGADEDENTDRKVTASTLYPDRKTRLTWTFPEETAAEGEAVVAESRPQERDTRRMTLYGIRAVYPPEFKPDSVQVHPANHMLSLEAGDHRRRVYRRWGLPDQVLRDDPPDAFFRKLLKSEGMRVVETCEDRVGSFAAFRVEFTAKGLTPFRRLCFQREAGRGWIWREPEAKRLCTLEILGESPSTFPKPEACLDVETA